MNVSYLILQVSIDINSVSILRRRFSSPRFGSPITSAESKLRPFVDQYRTQVAVNKSNLLWHSSSRTAAAMPSLCDNHLNIRIGKLSCGAKSASDITHRIQDSSENDSCWNRSGRRAGGISDHAASEKNTCIRPSSAAFSKTCSTASVDLYFLGNPLDAILWKAYHIYPKKPT